VRWGITLLCALVAGLFVSSFFFKYPDILKAQIVVTTENLPVGVVAKTAGRIDTVFVTEKQNVKIGEMLAYIENPAKLEYVMALKKVLLNFSVDTFSVFTTLTNGSLGEIQPAYISFIKVYRDYDYLLKADYHHKKITVIEKQISVQKTVCKNLKIS